MGSVIPPRYMWTRGRADVVALFPSSPHHIFHATFGDDGMTCPFRITETAFFRVGGSHELLAEQLACSTKKSRVPT
jgi:hypothetical protein